MTPPIDVEKRFELELRAGQVVISLSFINTPTDCVRDIVTDLVDAVMSPQHHALREELERDLLHRAATARRP